MKHSKAIVDSEGYSPVYAEPSLVDFDSYMQQAQIPVEPANHFLTAMTAARYVRINRYELVRPDSIRDYFPFLEIYHSLQDASQQWGTHP